MKKGVLVSIALIVMLAVGGTVFASGNHTDSLTISPSFSFQRIFYNAGDYEDRNGFGLGMDVSYDRFVRNRNAFGFACSYEYFVYNEFFNYNDFKVQVTGKLQLNKGSMDDKAKFYFTGGAGCDMVLRSDKDFGVYPLINLGIETAFKSSENMDTTFRLNSGLTIQDGSIVLQAEAGIGIRAYLNKPAAGEAKK